MSTPAPSTSSRRPLAFTLALILVMMAVAAFIGAYCIDQGRTIAGSVTAAADQAMRLRGAQLAVETARREAVSGHLPEARKALDQANPLIKSAIDDEKYDRRAERIRKAAKLADAFGATLASGGADADAAGQALAASLADLDARQARDLLETEVRAPVVVMQTLSLYGSLLLAVFGVSVVLAIAAVRVRPAG